MGIVGKYLLKVGTKETKKPVVGRWSGVALSKLNGITDFVHFWK